MRYSSPLFALSVAVVLSLTVVPSFADRAAADKCAAGLPAESKLIYAASIGAVTPGADLREIVRSKARSLVFAGKVDRGGARANAQAAGAYLMKAM